MQQPEEWRPVAGWPYEVSDAGRVRRIGPAQRNTWAGRVLKPGRKRHGYLGVDLSKDGKQKTVPVAILVCTAFHGPKPSPRHQVAHWNGNLADNRAANLRWATPKDNMADSRRLGTLLLGSATNPAKLTEEQVLAIRRRLESGAKQVDLAAEFGLCKATISHIWTRRNWKHI